jgi:hypothetical protein
MRKNLLRMAFATTLVCSVVLLMSCSDNDDTPNQEDSSLAECTVIFYGNGGRNLDADMHNNLRQLYRGLRSHSNMEAVVFIKNSANPDANMMKKFEEQGFDFRPATTYRFVVDRNLAENTQLQFTRENIYGGEGANIDISIADTLAHYISYAAKMRPARHYVLIMSNHGGGYVPQDDRPKTLEPTRGILYDDGHEGQCISVRAIRTAIERSGVSLDAVYLDACLMNCVETLYELHEVTPYIVSATYYTPDVGGEYTCLANRLATSTDYGQALAGYCDDVADYWLRCEEAGINPGDYDASDINAISSAQLRTAAPVLKAFIDQLTQDYGNTQLAQEIDAVTARAVANEETSPLFDLYSYFDDLAKSVSSTALADAARKAKDAMMKCKLNARGTKKTEEERLPSFNFLLGANGAWEDLKLDNDTKRLIYTATYNWDGTKQLTSYGADGKMTYQSEDKWGSTGDETYAKLRFEQLTGWSRWLKMNKQKPLSQYPK